MLSFVVSLAVLLIGSLLLSLLYELLAGNQSFSLPLSNIVLTIVAGGILYWFFGFKSTIAVLGVYAIWAVVGGLYDRHP